MLFYILIRIKPWVTIQKKNLDSIFFIYVMLFYIHIQIKPWVTIQKKTWTLFWLYIRTVIHTYTNKTMGHDKKLPRLYLLLVRMKDHPNSNRLCYFFFLETINEIIFSHSILNRIGQQGVK